jgi:ketosteroid isomerase-like protein
MMLRFMTIALAAFILIGAPPATAATGQRGDPAIIAAAIRYLDAYQALDLERLKALYSEDAAFNDPTSIHIRGIGGPFVWRGRTNILNGMRTWMAGGVTALQYDLEDVYEASGCVVFVGSINSFVSAPSGKTQYRYRIVTVVTIENGLVSEHRDYTDYAGAAEVAVNP